MNRLWVRLLAGFTLVALVAVGGVALLVNWNLRNLFEAYVHLAMRWRGVALARRKPTTRPTVRGKGWKTCWPARLPSNRGRAWG